MKENNLKKIWLISIFVLLIAFSMYLVFINRDEASFDSETHAKYEIVKNYNDFYTVNSCVFRYITYLQSSDADALLKVLDEDYIKENSINKDNVLNTLVKYDGNVTFSSKKMYEEKESSTVYKYYVYGYVEKDVMDSFPEQIETYFIVRLDKKNNIFTIEPYDGKIF